ncbi:MAG: helix-turn-helix transcriptional regulator [Gammaproteobacteria bacterium]|jgi:ribosome-binding protein aMBF1 (putative translation factor)
MPFDPVPHDDEEFFKIPGVLEEYNALEEEFAMIHEMIDARKKSGKTQKEIAKAMKTTQSVVARIESNIAEKHHSPTINTLRKYAAALGCMLQIKLVRKRKRRTK